jgi:pterin-4a-carbinolamine dehydratase
MKNKKESSGEVDHEKMKKTKVSKGQWFGLMKQLEKDWKVVDDKLVRVFAFEDEEEAEEFVQIIDSCSAEVNHYPKIDHKGNKVRMTLFTEESGFLTPLDFAYAQTVDYLIKEILPNAQSEEPDDESDDEDEEFDEEDLDDYQDEEMLDIMDELEEEEEEELENKKSKKDE